MIHALALVLMVAAATPADQQDHGTAMPGMSPAPDAPDPACPPEHAAMGHCTPAAGPPHGSPAKADEGWAADAVWGADAMRPARRAVYAEHGSMRTSKVMIDRLEYRSQKGDDAYSWEGEGWYGGDSDRLWVKTQGEGAVGGSLGSAEVQALWSRALDPWFNLQAGVRYDLRPTPDRAYLTVGVEGLAPYLFEVGAAAFVSNRGDLAVRVEAEYDQRIVGQLILQPRAEINLSTRNDRSADAGEGASSIEAGLRLRYEFVPEFAPYVGLQYERDFGRSGREAGGAGLVAGVRAWF